MKVIKAKRPLNDWSIETICPSCGSKLCVERKDVFYVTEDMFLHASYECCVCQTRNRIKPGDIPVNVIKTLTVKTS